MTNPTELMWLVGVTMILGAIMIVVLVGARSYRSTDLLEEAAPIQDKKGKGKKSASPSTSPLDKSTKKAMKKPSPEVNKAIAPLTKAAKQAAKKPEPEVKPIPEPSNQAIKKSTQEAKEIAPAPNLIKQPIKVIDVEGKERASLPKPAKQASKAPEPPAKEMEEAVTSKATAENEHCEPEKKQKKRNKKKTKVGDDIQCDERVEDTDVAEIRAEGIEGLVGWTEVAHSRTAVHTDEQAGRIAALRRQKVRIADKIQQLEESLAAGGSAGSRKEVEQTKSLEARAKHLEDLAHVNMSIQRLIDLDAGVSDAKQAQMLANDLEGRDGNEDESCEADAWDHGWASAWDDAWEIGTWDTACHSARDRWRCDDRQEWSSAPSDRWFARQAWEQEPEVNERRSSSWWESEGWLGKGSSPHAGRDWGQGRGGKTRGKGKRRSNRDQVDEHEQGEATANGSSANDDTGAQERSWRQSERNKEGQKGDDRWDAQPRKGKKGGKGRRWQPRADADGDQDTSEANSELQGTTTHTEGANADIIVSKRMDLVAPPLRLKPSWGDAESSDEETQFRRRQNRGGNTASAL